MQTSEINCKKELLYCTSFEGKFIDKVYGIFHGETIAKHCYYCVLLRCTYFMQYVTRKTKNVVVPPLQLQKPPSQQEWSRNYAWLMSVFYVGSVDDL